jgi:LacI family transcriptional regulator
MQQEDRPTAVFTTNHNITMGFLTAARERGMRIPEDIDIFGFDCVSICSMMRPPLPVVHQPEAEIGRTAAQYLIDRLNGYTGEPRLTRLICNVVGD